MELRQLEYLVAVAEEGSFTKAATRTHVAQPGISAQVRRLERELGHDVFDRSGRSVTLTEVGMAILPHARAALAAVDRVRTAVDELAGLVRGSVTVGMVTACGMPDVPDLLAGFHAAHPEVELRLEEGGSDRLVDDLLAGRLDVALVGLHGPTPPGLGTRLVVEEPIVAAVAPGHRLAGRRTISLKALRDESLIALPPGTGIRSAFDAAAAAAGGPIAVAFEASSLLVVEQLAAEGLGVAVLPSSMVESPDARLQGIELVRPRVQSRLELAWRVEGPHSPAATALIEHARRAPSAGASAA